MYRKIITQQPLTLVTLDEVKRQCRVFNTFEDVYLTSLILPFCNLAQTYTNRMLTTGSAIVVYEDCYATQQLPYGEVSDITEVLVDGVATTDYTFNMITQKITVKVRYHELTVSFDAGYSSTPDIVKQAVLVMINTAFVNREDVNVGEGVSKMPRTAEDLLDSVRYYVS